MNQERAIEKIESAGAILVFPIANQKEPASLWSAFYPRSQMRWEWDESGDNRVGNLWHLRTELSTTTEVVYAKWFRGRATFFSRDIFPAFLRLLHPESDKMKPLSQEAKLILEMLQEDSPQSPRVLRAAADLQGKLYESQFNRTLKELWNRLYIVGFGEIDDGAFPSLAIGSTKLLFEELWDDAFQMTEVQARKIIEKKLGVDNLFYKQLLRLEKQLRLNTVTESQRIRVDKSGSRTRLESF